MVSVRHFELAMDCGAFHRLQLRFFLQELTPVLMPRGLTKGTMGNVKAGGKLKVFVRLAMDIASKILWSEICRLQFERDKRQ
ncbi:hypothetical protein F2P81_003440 [Scophthalmus maximus]|uniref:Uncharacterized protein n=1 Tax=Scophthalmus maximus TaxID=52904 RepID=A0A6A4TQJ2_SCOMX|nr:hypothetical protein F2P81_003440 [Scophthalmus maximus]